MDSHSRWPRWGLSLFFIISLGLLTDYLFLHILFQKKVLEIRNQTLEEMTPTEAAIFSKDPATSESATTSLANAETTSSDKLQSFAKAFAACFAMTEADAPQTSEHFVQSLISKKLITSETVEIENFNLILPDGTERRLHIIPKENTNGAGREARYYKLDVEGYPERIPLPYTLSQDLTPSDLAKVSELGKIILHQTKKTYEIQNGDSLSLDVRNGQIFELQWRSQGKSFNCQLSECQCL